MDLMVGKAQNDIGIHGMNLTGTDSHSHSSDSSVGLIDLCSLCNRQFCADSSLSLLKNQNPIGNDKKVESGGIKQNYDKILNVFLADKDERSLHLQLCSNCNQLCESLLRSKQQLSNLIEHIINLLLQNSRFTLIHSKNVIIADLFSSHHNSNLHFTSLYKEIESNTNTGEIPSPIAGATRRNVEDDLVSMIELDRQIADLEFRFHFDKLKDLQTHRKNANGGDDSNTNTSTSSFPSLYSLFSASSTQQEQIRNNIMAVHLSALVDHDHDDNSHSRKSSNNQRKTMPSNCTNFKLSPSNDIAQGPLMISETQNEELELCFSNKLPKSKGKGVTSSPSTIANNTYSTPKKSKSSQKILELHCSKCPKISHSKKAHKLHVNSHEDKMHFCDICGASYRQKKNLDIHIGMHQGDPKFQCDICGKGFTQKSGLQRHAPIHTGFAAFQCEICGLKFLYSTSYNAHKQTHGDNPEKKKYKCSYCNLNFYTSYHLGRHEKTHTGLKPYKCKICSKSFAEKYNLESHLKVHVNGPPTELSASGTGAGKGSRCRKFQCELCQKVFDRKSKLNAHILKEHQNHTIKIDSMAIPNC